MAGELDFSSRRCIFQTFEADNDMPRRGVRSNGLFRYPKKLETGYLTRC